MNKSLVIPCGFLAVAMLVCLLPMPYGYYTLVRFATMIVMGCLAYVFYSSRQATKAVVSCALTLLFQPFVKIALGREVWGVVDLIVAIGLLYIVWQNRKLIK